MALLSSRGYLRIIASLVQLVIPHTTGLFEFYRLVNGPLFSMIFYV